MRSRLAQRDRNGCGFQKCLLELDCGGGSGKKVAKIGAPLRGGASLWELTREMGARRFVDDRFVARARRRHEFVATAATGPCQGRTSAAPRTRPRSQASAFGATP